MSFDVGCFHRAKRIDTLHQLEIFKRENTVMSQSLAVGPLTESKPLEFDTNHVSARARNDIKRHQTIYKRHSRLFHTREWKTIFYEYGIKIRTLY